MGLCMRVKKSGDAFYIGYGGYFALRYHIISCIDKDIADKWKKGCIYGKEYYLTLEEFKVLYDSKLTDFLCHSDCDGLLGRRKVKRTLLALEKLNFENKDWEKEFEELKNILRIAVENKSSIEYC